MVSYTDRQQHTAAHDSAALGFLSFYRASTILSMDEPLFLRQETIRS